LNGTPSQGGTQETSGRKRMNEETAGDEGANEEGRRDNEEQYRSYIRRVYKDRPDSFGLGIQIAANHCMGPYSLKYDEECIVQYIVNRSWFSI
jgi:hypothetical protein